MAELPPYKIACPDSYWEGKEGGFIKTFPVHVTNTFFSSASYAPDLLTMFVAPYR